MSWRRWAVVLAVATVGIGAYGFASQEWPAGYDPIGRCADEQPDVRDGYIKGPTSATIDRWPPGTHCRTKECRPRERGNTVYLSSCVTKPRYETFFVDARPTDYLLLGAFSMGTALVLTGLLFLLVCALLAARRAFRSPRRQPR
jgi:hypothetical protein